MDNFILFFAGSDDAVNNVDNDDSNHSHSPVHKRDPNAGSFALSNLEPDKYQACKHPQLNLKNASCVYQQSGSLFGF